MLDKINIENILFLDIETVPQYSDFDEVPKECKQLLITPLLITGFTIILMCELILARY